ncbi:MAG: hypothetical protein N4A37_11600 [Prolixibacteraceae bacterium]|jgi:hypothetical protein|nr:hypothetical protein [Prolixibacteraceae bacterium]
MKYLYWGTIILLIIFIITTLLFTLSSDLEFDDQLKMLTLSGALFSIFSSTIIVTYNNVQIKQREMELNIFKNKTEAYDLFLEALLTIIFDEKRNKTSPKAKELIIKFKKGLLNWGSSQLIKQYIVFEDFLNSDTKDEHEFFRQTNIFLRNLRKELGLSVKNDEKLLEIFLTSDSRAIMNAHS